MSTDSFEKSFERAMAAAEAAEAGDSSLHGRIAKALGWTIAEAQSFGFRSLRELVRPVNPKLASEIDYQIQSGEYVRGPVRKRGRR